MTPPTAWLGSSAGPSVVSRVLDAAVGPSVVVPPAPDSVPHHSRQREDGADHVQDDPNGPQEGDRGHETDDHQNYDGGWDLGEQ
jgi:hypothetical protein